MTKQDRIIARLEEGQKPIFEQECKRIGFNPSKVLRELVTKFIRDPKFRNSIRVSLEYKT